MTTCGGCTHAVRPAGVFASTPKARCSGRIVCSLAALPAAFAPSNATPLPIVQKCLVGAHDDPDWLFRRCQRIADLLGKGELALAQIYGLHIPIADLDDQQLERIALAGFAKAGFNPDEPRVPKGDHGGGEWTDGGGSSANAEPSSLLTDVAYQGTYHDQVVAQIVGHWRAKGDRVLTSVDLIARNGATARADIIAIQALGEPPLLIEVKTGNDPQFTPGQQIVYPMAQIGDHVNSPNQKIRELGFSPGQ